MENTLKELLVDTADSILKILRQNDMYPEDWGKLSELRDKIVKQVETEEKSQDTPVQQVRTYRDFLMTIPDEDIREKALSNCHKLDTECRSLLYAIWNGWVWGNSSEGEDYWFDYWNSLNSPNSSLK